MRRLSRGRMDFEEVVTAPHQSRSATAWRFERGAEATGDPCRLHERRAIVRQAEAPSNR